MPDSINVPIFCSVFTRLQRLAIPLVDDTNSVIERLIDHWESNPPEKANDISQDKFPGDCQPNNYL